jgi:hypothetical protein
VPSHRRSCVKAAICHDHIQRNASTVLDDEEAEEEG